MVQCFEVAFICSCAQSIYEDVARDTNRGHTVESVKDCFVMAKDAGFKVGCTLIIGVQSTVCNVCLGVLCTTPCVQPLPT